MGKLCFILAGSQDRAHLLKRCISCVNNNALYRNADIYLYWQGKRESIPCVERFSDIVISDSLRGVFLPRYVLFERFGVNYEYTILIDDDLFMYPDTTYETAIAYLAMNKDNGVCNIGWQFEKRRNELRKISYNSERYNVYGGLVFPNKCVKTIVDFFKGTDENVTEDIFWILLYVKGFDLYRDFSSNAVHTCHRKSIDGKESGYYKMRLEKPYKPLLPQYTKGEMVKDEFGNGMRWKIPECKDVNNTGMAERKRCRKEMGLI